MVLYGGSLIIDHEMAGMISDGGSLITDHKMVRDAFGCRIINNRPQNGQGCFRMEDY